MLVLAYCVGLRVGEIVRLTLGDIHLGDQTIEIWGTKFFNSRHLPATPFAEELFLTRAVHDSLGIFTVHMRQGRAKVVPGILPACVPPLACTNVQLIHCGSSGSFVIDCPSGPTRS
jgi:hypothetical protein